MRYNNERGMELMDYMVDNGIKSGMLPLSALTEKEGLMCLIRMLVVKMEFARFKDLDKMLKTNLTSRSMKISSKKTRTKDPLKKINVASELMIEANYEYDLLEMIIKTATNTVLKIISRSKTAARKILEDIETEAGRKKLFLLITYSIAEASIEATGEFTHSRTMELFVNTRRENAQTLRRIFSRNSWEDAVEMFIEFMETKKTALISSEANDDLVEEKMIYNLVNKEDLLGDLWLLADKVRENVTGQVRIGLENIIK
ncbi:MAG: hypothetical protein ACRCZ0_04475 [Cetobacterium sp.]